MTISCWQVSSTSHFTPKAASNQVFERRKECNDGVTIDYKKTENGY
jgi:hypothetical protein